MSSAVGPPVQVLIEPSLPPREGSLVTTAKLGIDATQRWDKPANIFDIPRTPFAAEPLRDPEHERIGMNREELTIQIVASLPQGPRFIDLLKRSPRARSADLVNVIEWLRERAAIKLDRDGRYWPGER